MSKQRDMNDKDFLETLIKLREDKFSKNDFIKKQINVKKCRPLGLFSYRVKESGENKEGRLFLLSEIHDGNEYDIIYNEDGDVIAYNDYSNEEGLKLAREVLLDKDNLEKQILRDLQMEQEEDNSSNDDSSKAGEGRDLASKEHEEEENNKEKKEEKKEVKKEDKEEKKLRNLKNDISMNDRIKIRLDTIVNGYHLWEILGIQDILKDKMPKGVSEREFQSGFLTIIDSKELNDIEASRGEKVKERKAEDTFAIVSQSGNIIELDEDVIEAQYLGTRDERVLQEQNRERWADGKHTFKPQTDMTLARTSKWRIKNVDSRFQTNEEWFLGVDYNEDYVRTGSQPSVRKYLKEISIIQEPKYTERVYNRDSAEGRTRHSVEYKLEDVSEPPLNEEEQKQQNQLEERNSDEALNVRKEHEAELEKIVETLTEKYGENYRDEITQRVEKEHKKGNDIEQIKKNVKEQMDDIEDENFRHPGGRNM